jgi:hypothetical protein
MYYKCYSLVSTYNEWAVFDFSSRFIFLLPSFGLQSCVGQLKHGDRCFSNYSVIQFSNGFFVVYVFNTNQLEISVC